MGRVTPSLRPLFRLRRWRDGLRSLRLHGWRYGPAQILEKWADRRFDARHGTDTRRFAELRTLQIASPDRRAGERYQPSPVWSLRRVLRRLDVDVARSTFVDIGCGKGRTLMIASELPFARVVGVDFSAELVDCARRNLARFGARACRDVAALHADATAFDWPPGDLVIYLFQPFNHEVLARVLGRAARSLREAPRRAWLVYLHLDAVEAVEAHGFALRRRWRNYWVFEFAST